MATSGTTAFNLNIDDIIQEGYQRCGLRTNSGYDLRSARTSLNLLFAEWGNRGIHLWKVELNEKSLVSGQAAYTIINLYQTPDLNTYTALKYYVIKRIEDAGAYSNDADVAYRFLPCMAAGLGYYLSMKVNPKLVQQNKQIYEDEMKRALDEDGQRTSTFISPQSFYPSGV
jgi:hypothetical protein